MRFRHRTDNCHVLAMVDVDKILDLFVAEAAAHRHEAVIEGLLGKIIEDVAHTRFIGRMDRPEVYLGPVFKQIGQNIMTNFARCS